MKRTLIILSVAALIVGCAHDRHSDMGAVGAASGKISGSGASSEAAFAREACHSGVATAEIGKLAATNTRNEAVRNLAKRLVKEHSQAEKELEQLFARKGLSAEPQLAESLQSSINNLAALKGPAFDRAFKQQVTADHQKAIEAFEQQAAQGTDPDFKAFAEKHLPHLRAHLAMAEQLEVGPADASSPEDAESGTLHKGLKGPPIQTPVIR